MRVSLCLIGSLIALTTWNPAHAQAQQTETTTSTTGAAPTTTTTTVETAPATTTTETTTSTSVHDEQALLEERTPTEPVRDPLDPREAHDETYLFLGVMARALVIPQFMINIFVAEGSSPIDGGGGIYFNYRRNAFNVQVEAYYQSFYTESFFRGAGDPIGETEWVKSELAVIMGNVSFGWAFDVTEWFAFELGFGIGFGGVIGNLWRQEAYLDPIAGWRRCTGPNQPMTPNDYCENSVERPNPSNGHLDNGRVRGGTYQYQQGSMPGTGPSPFYFGEGGIPPIFFNLDLPRIAFRFKPIHQVQLRIEAAYNLYAFSFGASAGYGF